MTVDSETGPHPLLALIAALADLAVQPGAFPDGLESPEFAEWDCDELWRFFDTYEVPGEKIVCVGFTATVRGRKLRAYTMFPRADLDGDLECLASVTATVFDKISASVWDRISE